MASIAVPRQGNNNVGRRVSATPAEINNISIEGQLSETSVPDSNSASLKVGGKGGGQQQKSSGGGTGLGRSVGEDDGIVDIHQDFEELTSQGVILGDVYQSMAVGSPGNPPLAVSEGAESPQHHQLEPSSSHRGGGSHSSTTNPSASSATMNHLREDYEQLQVAMGIISTQAPQTNDDPSGSGGSGKTSPQQHLGGSSALASSTASHHVTQTSRCNFESLSREMLVDYCWEVHQTMLRALYVGPDGNIIAADGTAIPRPPSTLYGGLISRGQSMAGGWDSSSSNVVTAAGAAPGATGMTPMPPNHDRPRGSIMSSGGGRNHSNLSSIYAAPHRVLSSMTTASSSAHSIQSMARPAVQTTLQVEKAVDQEGRKMINQYCLLDEIGKGCFGKVKLAYNTQQGQLVAVKVMKRIDPNKRAASAAQAASNAAHRNRSMQKEIAVMKKLRHKNIVALYEVIDDSDSCSMYLAMQYVDQGHLGAVDKNFHCKKIDQKTMANYGRQICAGLQYLHNHNVVHRDIKPDNILKDSNDQVYLADFGVSEIFDVEEEETTNQNSSAAATQATGKFGKKVHGRRGTPAFMAPELMIDAAKDHDGFAIDVWALGVTFYALLFGKIPFCSKEEITEKPVSFPKASEQVNPSQPDADPVSAEWVDLLRRMLEKDPANRPTVDEIRKTVRTMHKEQELKEQLAQAKAQSRKNSSSSGSQGPTEIEVVTALTPMTRNLAIHTPHETHATTIAALRARSPASGGIGGGGDSPQHQQAGSSPNKHQSSLHSMPSSNYGSIASMSPNATVHSQTATAGGSMAHLTHSASSGHHAIKASDPIPLQASPQQQQQQQVGGGSPQLGGSAHLNTTQPPSAVAGTEPSSSSLSPQSRSQPVAVPGIDGGLTSGISPAGGVSNGAAPGKAGALPPLQTPRRVNSSSGVRQNPSGMSSSGRMTETHDPPSAGASTARGLSTGATPTSAASSSTGVGGTAPPPIMMRPSVVTSVNSANKTAASKARAKLEALKAEEANLSTLSVPSPISGSQPPSRLQTGTFSSTGGGLTPLNATSNSSKRRSLPGNK